MARRGARRAGPPAAVRGRAGAEIAVGFFRRAAGRRAQADAPAEGRVRPRGNFQPRMLRRGALMADAETRKNAAPAFPGLVRDVVEYDLLFDCVHCGLCLESCPTYLLTRAEMDSPRGRIYLMKSLAEGRVALDDDVVRHLDSCLGCRGCESACPSGIHYGRLLERARDFVGRNHRRGFIDAIRHAAVRFIFPYPARLRVMLWPLRAAERLGLRGAVRSLMPYAMREWIDLLPELTRDSPVYPGSPE